MSEEWIFARGNFLVLGVILAWIKQDAEGEVVKTASDGKTKVNLIKEVKSTEKLSNKRIQLFVDDEPVCPILADHFLPTLE